MRVYASLLALVLSLTLSPPAKAQFFTAGAGISLGRPAAAYNASYGYPVANYSYAAYAPSFAYQTASYGGYSGYAVAPYFAPRFAYIGVGASIGQPAFTYQAAGYAAAPCVTPNPCGSPTSAPDIGVTQLQGQVQLLTRAVEQHGNQSDSHESRLRRIEERLSPQEGPKPLPVGGK